ncbi:hypothetical protein [Micromonospora auratinigra]|uniref:Uncharacterized protein n=1 Tax=Micromonospora auratinigra TaxID=261654 RepID=A0A1A9A1G3_9ACTN|nr:hypothetical protein [Micromonospora auratinigra]SBT49924.1 hypothetical protein GA0070611_4593 [Micromonospora auratinigra]
MARRGWGASIATALGVAAGTGAAQLGFGYGLGIINWAPPGGATAEAAWVASLAWATWISATSVVAGAVVAHRLRGEDDEPGRTLRNLTLAVAAGVGALITVLLVAVPARAARVPDTFAPETVAAGYAAVGLLTGLLLASWALHSRAAADNLVATTGWLWLLAVVSVVDGVLSGRGLTTAQLGIWQISADSDRFWIRDYFYWPGALLSLGSALLIGMLAARRTARLPQRRIGAAASGAAGPFLVALAYLLAVPRLAAIAPEQVSAHLIAPYAVIAGLGGSVLVAALAQRAELRATTGTGSTPGGSADDPADRRAGRPDSGAPGDATFAADEAAAGSGPDTREGRAAYREPAGVGVEPVGPDLASTSAEPARRRRTPTTGSATPTTEPGTSAAGVGVPTSEASAEVDPSAGRARSGASRATGARSRAVPPQRKPTDPPLVSDPAVDQGDDVMSPADEPAPPGGTKARRRSR